MYGWMYDEYNKLKSKSKSNEEDEKQNDTTYPCTLMHLMMGPVIQYRLHRR